MFKIKEGDLENNRMVRLTLTLWKMMQQAALGRPFPSIKDKVIVNSLHESYDREVNIPNLEPSITKQHDCLSR